MTREQTRATLAWKHVVAVGDKHGKDSPGRKTYGTLAGKLPSLLRSAGFCQAVHFLRSRRKKDAKPNQPDMAELLLGHLAEQLGQVSQGIGADIEALCKAARESPLPVYLWLSREAVACATWYARLAKSELEVEPTDDAPEDNAAEPEAKAEAAP
ncbi:MAG: type III-B CRISPR module-associated protein Cmr5 [Acidobacteriota bacterium]